MFEEFKGVNQKSVGEPMMTVLKSGNLAFNKSAHEKYFKDYSHTRLFYDKEQRLIGVKLEKEKQPNSAAVRVNQRNKSVNLSALAFLNHYEIPYQGNSRRYPLEYDEKQQMLIADLKQPIGGE